MARTWTLHDSLSNGWNFAGNCDTNQEKTVVYYYDNTAFGYPMVYSYDGTTQTALSLNTTWGTGLYINSIAYFNNNLYVSVESPTESPAAQVYKYDGSGTSWTSVWSASSISPTYTEKCFLARDENYLYTCAKGTPSNVYTIAKTSNGSSWTEMTYGAAQAFKGIEYLYGLNNGSTIVWAAANEGYPYAAITPDTGTTWSIEEADTSNGYSFGYAAGYSFWVDAFNSPYSVKRSSNWGATYGDAAVGGLDNPFNNWQDDIGPPYDPARQCVHYFRDDALMAATGFDVNVFVFDGTKFITDGTIPDATYNCIGYFEINNNLYAIGRNSSGFIRIYDGGGLSGFNNTGEFFFGIDTLEKKTDLSFSVNPKGMAVNTKTNDVVIVGNVQQAMMASKLLVSEDYSSENDFTDGLDTATDTDYNTVEYI